MKLILFAHGINKIGGVETFVINFCKRMCKYYEITVLYEFADMDKIIYLSNYATVEKLSNKKYKADICLYGTAWGNRPESQIEALKYIQVLHADYRNVIENWPAASLKLTPKTEFVVSVGESVRQSVIELYGIDSTVIYNLLNIDIKPQKNLRLVTASRISPEKGFLRISKMAHFLKDSNKPFSWDIYGDTPSKDFKNKIINLLSDVPEVSFKGTKTNVIDYVSDADYLVQLSDSEGFSYSIYEALQVGTPCIVTNFKSASEQIVDGKNGYILDMDLSNLDIDKIYNHIPNEIIFNEKSSEKDWLKLMGTPKSKPKQPKPLPYLKTVNLIAIKPYYDIELCKKIAKGELLPPVTEERAKKLLSVCEVIK